MVHEPSYPEVGSNANNAAYGMPPYPGMTPTGNTMQMPYGSGGYMPTNMPVGQQAPPVHAMQSMYGNMQLSQQQQQQQQMHQQQMTGLGAQPGSQTVSVLDFKPDVLAHYQEQQRQLGAQAAYNNARAQASPATMGLLHADGRYSPATDAAAAHAGHYPAGYPGDPGGYSTGAYAGRHSEYSTDAMMPADRRDGGYYHNTGRDANDIAYARGADRERRARAFEQDRFPSRPPTERAVTGGGGGMSSRDVKAMIEERLHVSSAADAKREEQKRQVGSAVKKVMEQYHVTPKSDSSASGSFTGETTPRRGGSARPDSDYMGETSSRRGGSARSDSEYRPY